MQAARDRIQKGGVVSTKAVACPAAPLGRGDPTRSWGVRCPDGAVRWPGLTRVEADAIAGVVPPEDPAPGDVLVQIALDVVLTDGAGPYLLDADGLLVLVVGGHPAGGGVHVAMGQPGPERVRVGAVVPAGAGGRWRWIARAEVPATLRIATLDALAAAGDTAALEAWAARTKSPGIP